MNGGCNIKIIETQDKVLDTSDLITETNFSKTNFQKENKMPGVADFIKKTDCDTNISK